jgi:RNA polymerase sigma-70 factor (sigma-E family)
VARPHWGFQRPGPHIRGRGQRWTQDWTWNSRTFVDGRFTALQRFGYLLTGEWHLAEDLVQTSLTKVWFRRKSLRNVVALESYTRTVMVNTSTQWWRRKWKGETPTEFLPEASAPSPYGVVEDRDRLLRALATLPRRTRAAMVLRYFEDLPDAEIAQIMGCSTSTVKSSVSRGLAKLREHHLLADTAPLITPAPKEG